MNNIYNFLSFNVNGLNSSKKRIKMFEYFREKISKNNGIIFLQETHSCENTYNDWRNDFKGDLFFSHGTTNSCGVMIGYLGNNNFHVNKIKSDSQGRILIIDTDIDNQNFVLINLYNANVESEQLKTLCELDQLLSDFCLDSNKKVVFAGDFNLFFNADLEASGGNPILKKKSISKLLQLIEKNNLVDIWRVRNPKLKRYTFRKNHFSGFIQRRLDYIFVSNSVQENFNGTHILPSFCSDHSPLFFKYQTSNEFTLGKNFWKFKISLTKDEEYIKQMKAHIQIVKNQFSSIFNDAPHSQWEFLKYEIRKFSISFSKRKAKEKREKIAELESKLKEFEENLNNVENLEQYKLYKTELSEFYDDISNGIKIRSKCNWYEFGEKSNKFFLNLEKHRATQNVVRKIISKDQEITELPKINNIIFEFYQNLFSEKQYPDEDHLNNILSSIDIPSLNNEEMLSCEGELTEQEIFSALLSFKNNKSPGNDGLTKEFYHCFWEDIKDIFMNSLSESKKLKQLPASQMQAIIKLLEKPNKDKRYVANWRPISLLNFDLKLISKSLATRLKNVLGKLIDSRQTAYVNERFIGESGRLIDDVIKVCDMQKLSGYLLTIDFEKAFDSLNHNFIFTILKKYGFGNNFIDWIRILFNSQESCVINGGHSTKYFPLERGARQGDPISAYLFVLALEIFFHFN